MLAPPTTTRKTLLSVWRDWEDMPGHPDRAHRVEVAFGDHAAHLGLRTTQFRDLCASWRRAELSRSEAVSAVEAGVASYRQTGAFDENARAVSVPLHPDKRSS